MNIADINPHIRYAKEQGRATNNRNTPLLTPSFSRNYDARLFYFISASGWLESDGRKYNISNKKVDNNIQAIKRKLRILLKGE